MTIFEDLLAEADLRLDGLSPERVYVEAGGRRLIVDAVRDQDRLLTGAQDWETFPFGVLLWESAIVMADVVAGRDDVAGASVLELGAGSGLAGIAARHAGARVVQTDRSLEALALCRRNALANGLPDLVQRFGDWSDWRDRTPYDVVIGADVLYDRDRYDDLKRVLDVACRPGGLVLLTDPGRTHAGLFVEKLQGGGWSVSVERRTTAALPPCAPGATVGVDVIAARRA